MIYKYLTNELGSEYLDKLRIKDLSLLRFYIRNLALLEWIDRSTNDIQHDIS